MQNYFLDSDSPWIEVDPGVRRKVLAHDDNLMICHLHFDKGAIGSMHSHPHEQISYILSGKFEFDIGGNKKIVGAGDTTYKESNVIHGAICLEEGELLDIFTPERKDFLVTKEN